MCEREGEGERGKLFSAHVLLRTQKIHESYILHIKGQVYVKVSYKQSRRRGGDDKELTLMKETEVRTE